MLAFVLAQPSPDLGFRDGAGHGASPAPREFELAVELLHTVSLGLEMKPSGVAVSSACRATVASSTAPVSSVNPFLMILSLSYSSSDSIELNRSMNRRIGEESPFGDV